MQLDVPQVMPVLAAAAPKVDGRLDEACWKRAARVTGFTLNTGPKKAKEQTIVMVCYDSRNLYLGFECLESQMDKVKPVYSKDGQTVWQDDCIEIFIAPYAVADYANYHHFVVNAAGAKTYLRAESPEPNNNWRAAVTRQDDRWLLEVAIPFATLTPCGKNEDCWRINFCREEHPLKETSSWAPVPGKFSSFWKFGRLLQPEKGPRFVTFRSKLQPLPPSGNGSGAKVVDKVPETSETAKALIPTPYEMHSRRNNGFRIDRATRIVVGQTADAEDLRAAEEINQEMKERLGYELKVVRANAVEQPYRNVIIVGEPSMNTAADAVCQENRLRCDASHPGKEGYVIDTNEDRVLIAGSDRLGTFWGAETMRELIRTGHGLIPGTLIIDKPAFHFRGVHLLSSKDALKFHTRMIEEVLSRYKINNIVLQTDKIAWASHPEIRDSNNFMPEEDVTKLIEVARKHHITVTPLVQSMGHMEWVFQNKQHMDLAEDPSKPYALCPLKQASYDFLFDIIDEAWELFQHPAFFHVGLDEFDMLGRFPYDGECKKIGKYELYYRNAIKLHNHLKRKGSRMMMWGDILTKVEFSEKIDELPRDVLINDWRYGPADAFPSVDFYKEHGFETVGCTWYNPKNIYSFSKYASEKRISGMLQTTWTGYQTEDVVLQEWPEQLYAYILGAAWAWNPGKPALQDLDYEPASVFHTLWDGEKPESKETKWFTVDLSSYTNICTADSGRRVGWLGVGRGADLRQMPTGLVNFDGVPYRLIDWSNNKSTAILLRGPSLVSSFPTAVNGIAVGSKAETLHFLHTTGYADGKGTAVGEYKVHYADGSVEEISLVYGTNVTAWNDHSPTFAYASTWRGHANGNGVIRLKEFVWKNPHPDKTIESIDFISTGTQAAPVLLAVTGEGF